MISGRPRASGPARAGRSLPKAGGRALSPARDQFAALLPVSERVSGAEHPETLTTRANLAYWTGQAGDAAPELS